MISIACADSAKRRARFMVESATMDAVGAVHDEGVNSVRSNSEMDRAQVVGRGC